jgi:hypothetical protein
MRARRNVSLGGPPDSGFWAEPIISQHCWIFGRIIIITMERLGLTPLPCI